MIENRKQDLFMSAIKVLVGMMIGMLIVLIPMSRTEADSNAESDAQFLESFEQAVMASCACAITKVDKTAEPIAKHMIQSTEEEITRPAEEPAKKYLIDVSQEDIDLMARVVMSEASILSFDAKQAIAQTIVNRVRTDFNDFKNMNTVTEVVNYPNAYSTQDNGKPNADCYYAVEIALTVEAFPDDMFWFREDYYHEFGIPYMNIGSTYFSRGISNGN